MKSGLDRSINKVNKKVLEITIPIYNEAKTLKDQVLKLLEYIKSLENDVIMIKIVLADNGSTDGTDLIVSKLENTFSEVRSVRLGKPGVGAALKESWGTSNSEYVGYMDLDFSTSLSHIREVIDILLQEEETLVIGSRWRKESDVVNRSSKRGITSFLFNKIMKINFSQAPSDSMCGFKFLNKKLYDNIILNFDLSDNWFFSAELPILSKLLSGDVIELPVRWVDDPESKVKIFKVAIMYLKAMRDLKAKMLNYEKGSFKIKDESVHLGRGDLNFKSKNGTLGNKTREKENSIIHYDEIILGTSSWGSKVDKKTAYKMTKKFHEKGFTILDTATNYPIDNIPENYGLALRWIEEFIEDMPELKIYVKVGSANNSGDSETILNESYLRLIVDSLKEKLGSNLLGIGIHWDDRGMVKKGEEQTAIIKFFKKIQGEGLLVGLSGIKEPSNYEVPEIRWLIQKKYDSHQRVVSSPSSAYVYAYGAFKDIGSLGRAKILKNEGDLDNDGIKKLIIGERILNIRSMGYDGFLVGPSTSEQLEEIVEAYISLEGAGK